MAEPNPGPSHLRRIFFGTGCFWCTEAVFSKVKGVTDTEPGFMGGGSTAVTYEDVCRGHTRHAEVLRIDYDPAIVSLERLLSVFWRCHDPTSINRQGNDVGPQYRSCIFTPDASTQQAILAAKDALDAAGLFGRKIVTQVEQADHFTSAGPAHKNYFARYPENGYCAAVIRPKLAQLKDLFATIPDEH